MNKQQLKIELRKEVRKMAEEENSTFCEVASTIQAKTSTSKISRKEKDAIISTLFELKQETDEYKELFK